MYNYNDTSSPSHRALTNLYRDKFYERVAAREIRPIVLPYHAFGFFMLIVYLCIPHVGHPWLYAARWPVLAAIIVFEIKKISESGSMSVGMGFGIGLVAAWCIASSTALLVWTRPQFNAKRIKRRIGSVPGGAGKVTKDDLNTSNETFLNAAEGPKLRLQQKDQTKVSSRQTTNAGEDNGKASAAKIEYYWQSYPKDSILDRLDWVLDLVCNFRYPGWNWEISTNPGLPAKIKVGLSEPIDFKAMKLKSPTGNRQFVSRIQLFMAQFPRFIAGYLLLDAIKIVMIKDPFFLIGPNDFPLPLHLSSLSPITLLAYRELLSLFGIIVALEVILLTIPLSLCIILGPSIVGERGEAWMYPTTWGSFENVHAKGLAGLWGGWWHQTFRFVFLAPSDYLIRRGILVPRTHTTKIITLLTTFAISASLHACGSIMQFPDTIPGNQVLFFFLQPVGILLQTGFCTLFRFHIDKLTPQFRRAGNFSFAFTWMFLTSPLIVNDFARGGVWLYEPIPISPLRGLGFGEDADRRWWVWDFYGMWYANGRRWWECGWLI